MGLMDGWYTSRSGSVYGPYAWNDLVEHARSGLIAPTDSVAGPSTNGAWVPASNVPGLFARPVAPPVATRPAAAAARQPRGSRVVTILAVGAVVLTLALCGVGSLLGDSSSSRAVAYRAPDASSLVETRDWGVVPADQVVVMLEEGASARVADKAADAVGGTVTGRLDFIGVHVIQTSATTEGRLRAAIEAAGKVDGVEAAFANEPMHRDTVFEGVPCTPLDDRVYKDGRDRPLQVTGTPRAWDILRAAGIPLSKVAVGVADDGLYRNAESKGATKFVTGETDDQLAAPLKRGDGSDNKRYSHGTMVASVIGADPDNGGMTGIAGPLGDKLTISMKNVFGGKYGVNATATSDASDPTRIDYSDGTFAMGDLVALKKLVDDGSKVINCSWGNTKATKHTAAAYKRFFEYMNSKHPDVLFVCSAGNDGIVVDGSTRIPSGLALPNMVTVGNVGSDGTNDVDSNMSSSNYEVTLAAPGEHIVGGVSPDGEVQNDLGGTSSAAPQVTAAAALLLAVDPGLKAADLKRILAQTARTELVSRDGKSKERIDPALGGRVLAVDEALLKVVNDARAKKGLPPLTDETIAKTSRILLTVTSGKDEMYQVVATVPAADAGGCDVELSYQGAGSIGGLTKQHAASGGEVRWTATLLDDSLTIHTKRLDNGSCARVRITGMAGTYKGDYVGFVGSAKYKVPITVVVEPDGTFRGRFAASTSLSSVGISHYSESGDFSGKVKKDGTLSCKGTARLTAKFKSGNSVSNTGAFKLKGTLSGDRLKGTMTGVGGSVHFSLTRT